AQENLKPEQLVTIVVGNSEAMTPGLDSLEMPVTPIDISIPGAPA
ncbi:MAG: insulinase family protein, partial [Leptolyngbya sp. SIO4C1]|nr:insulinase family protein [Leptolyngbya sp. SIO4C1]